MNKVLLHYYMSKKRDDDQMLAKALKIHRTTLASKMNGFTEFKLSELAVIRQRYDLKPNQFYEVFFNMEGE